MLPAYHFVALSVELDNVGPNCSCSYSTHLGNLCVRQNFSVEAVSRPVSVLNQAHYLVRSQMAPHNSRNVSHFCAKIFIIISKIGVTLEDS